MKKYNEPQIYIVNNQEIAERLSGNYVVANGNLGLKKVVKYKQYENNKYVNLEYSMIDNLHEYSLIIFDLQNKSIVKYCEENEEPNGTEFVFELNYPHQEFNPAPYVLNILKSSLGTQCLKIIFAGENYTEHYKMRRLNNQKQYSSSSECYYNIFGLIHAKPKIKCGKKMVPEKNNDLANVIFKYAKEYKVIFDICKMIGAHQTYKPDCIYMPIMKNKDGDIISYLGITKNYGYELLLPVCEKKDELIEELITSVLPEITPEIFPESKEFAWIKEREFWPKEIHDLEREQETIKAEYEKKMVEIDNRRITINQKYKFLNDLLTETGNTLVEAVCTYFKWLGFNNVVSIDDREDVLREDIQITEGEKMYIIEVKGLGGTSTDADCSQVAKHRRRREKENTNKEIIPIYIVNHQRYTRPQFRRNPPFSDDQIDYAKNDERGLLTTWQLYKQYKFIEDGIFTKKETRDSLNEVGLISLIPNSLASAGIIKEYYNKPRAGIINLYNFEIKVGDEIYAKKDENWIRTKIVSIQINDETVESASNGEVGIVTDEELNTGYKIFKKLR